MLKTLIAIGTVATATGCMSPRSSAPADAPVPPRVGMANPASVYCVEKGGTLTIKRGPEGESGICRMPDGTEIEEWALFRRDHPAGN